MHLFWLFKQEELFRTCSDNFFIIKVTEYQVCVHDICQRQLQAFLISWIIHQMEFLSCLGTPYIPWYSFPKPQLLSVMYFICFFFLFVCLYISLYLFLFLSHSVLVLHSRKFIVCCVVILWYLCPPVESELVCCEFGFVVPIV